MTDPNTQPPSNQPPAYQPPAYPTQTPASSYPNTYGASNGPVPGKTLGIVALILAIVPFTQLIGLILGIVALVQSRKAGAKNGIALAAIIVGAALLVISIILVVVLVVGAIAIGGDLASQVQACIDNGGTGFVEWQGVTLSCEEVLSESGY